MARIALKIDVDTDRGTREGVPRLATLLERRDINATFLLSLGPDHTGRAIRRLFRRGFLIKVHRTSVMKHYGLKSLLYGTLLPGPQIGMTHAALLRSIANCGFEVGVHSFDHTRWQDGVADADEDWTRCELQQAHGLFMEIFGRAPRVHGAAGWQINEHVPALEHEFGFDYASDVRGSHPFRPTVDGTPCQIPQLPTTLPTLDELLGNGDDDPIDTLLRATDSSGGDQVFTLHAELEGGAYLGRFEQLLRDWRAQGHELCSLCNLFSSLDPRALPVHWIEMGQIRGRSGVLAKQGAAVAENPRA
jgi:undecaprenyl phosphate-alpha-L-ara4FN deformylase